MNFLRNNKVGILVVLVLIGLYYYFIKSKSISNSSISAINTVPTPKYGYKSDGVTEKTQAEHLVDVASLNKTRS